jgi:hypothetical protein
LHPKACCRRILRDTSGNFGLNPICLTVVLAGDSPGRSLNIGGTSCEIASFNACVLVMMATSGLTAAENPFVRTWKLNPTKSEITGDTMQFERMPSGRIRFSASGLSYTFNPDGREYPGFLGELIAWKQMDDHTWETTYKLNGRLLSTDTSKLSPDSKTITVVSRGTRPNGQSFQDTTAYERMSGDNGLFGKWKDKEFKISSPLVVKIASTGDGGLTLKFVQDKSTCTLKSDGKDYAFTGPTVAPGVTLTAKRIGPRSFEFWSKQNGTPLFKALTRCRQMGTR